MYGGGEGETVMKKGPWTEAEDETLAAYVREHGEGNWNMVQKKTWLARCGKSCRLRWANHLRPNLRKGSFTSEEKRLIIQLHSQLGNKWARMATQLPGRTDNEIKNYWNTRLKRFQRQGVPLYPPDIFLDNPTSSFTFQTPSPPPLLQPHSLLPNRCYLNDPDGGHFTPSSYQSTYPVYSVKPELPSNQIPYSTSLGVYGLSNLTDKDNFSNSLHLSTCQLLEDVMEEVEALACPPPKRRHLMPAPEDYSNFSYRFGSSNNLFPLQGLKPKEEESLQMNIIQDDIANLLDWGINQDKEISNEHSSVEENLVLDDHYFAFMFPVDEETPAVSSWSWDSFPSIYERKAKDERKAKWNTSS